jgi:hypothetical protein
MKGKGMKFELYKKDIIKTEDNCSLIKVKTESDRTRVALGLILGIILCAIFSCIINLIFFGNSIDFLLIRYIYILFLIIPFHEAIHIIFLPKPNNAIVGFSLKHFVPYVRYEEEIHRSRYMLISVSPLIALSVFPLFLLPFFKSVFLVSFILLNALASGIDMLTFFTIKKLPEGAIIKMVGNELYYRKEN